MELAARLVFALVMVAPSLPRALRRNTAARVQGLISTETSRHSSIGHEQLGMSERAASAQRRIVTCSERTPWTGLRKSFGGAKNSSALGDFVALQLRERISTQGRVIDQGREGLCGPVSLEYMMVLLRPDDFAESVADLFCDGQTSKLMAKGRSSLVVPKGVLECVQSVGDRESLWGFQKNGFIHVVDWIWSASLVGTHNFMLNVCAGAGQGQSPGDMMRMTTSVFPEASVRMVGGLSRHVWRTVSGLGMRARHVSVEEWESTLDEVSAGGQAMLTVLYGRKNKGEVLRSATNHWVVLTQVINSSFVGGLGQWHQMAKCARKLLNETKACLVWTHAGYQLFESCDNLRKGVADVISIKFPEGQGPLNPRDFRPGSPWNRDVLTQLTQLSAERRLGLAGLWPGSKVVANGLVSVHSGSTLSVISPGTLGHIVQRDMDGDIAVVWTNSTSGWVLRKDFPRLAVTSMALGWDERAFTNRRGTFAIIGRSLVGRKQKAQGWPDENYTECPVHFR